jgi:hypothetical protein
MISVPLWYPGEGGHNQSLANRDILSLSTKITKGPKRPDVKNEAG